MAPLDSPTLRAPSRSPASPEPLRGAYSRAQPLGATVNVNDLPNLAERLHREVHPDGPRLAGCPFHDAATFAERAQRLLIWIASGS